MRRNPVRAGAAEWLRRVALLGAMILGVRCVYPIGGRVVFEDTNATLCALIVERGLTCAEGEPGCAPYLCTGPDYNSDCLDAVTVFARARDLHPHVDEHCAEVEWQQRRRDGEPFYYAYEPSLCDFGGWMPESVVPVCVVDEDLSGGCR